jgi:hypothetical protein
LWWENVHDYTSIDANFKSFSSFLLIAFAAADIDTCTDYTGVLVLGVVVFFCLITTIAWLGAQHQSLPLPRCCFVLWTKKQRKNRNTATGTVPIFGTSAMEGLMDDACKGTSGLATGSNVPVGDSDGTNEKENDMNNKRRSSNNSWRLPPRRSIATSTRWALLLLGSILVVVLVRRNDLASAPPLPPQQQLHENSAARHVLPLDRRPRQPLHSFLTTLELEKGPLPLCQIK